MEHRGATGSYRLLGSWAPRLLVLNASSDSPSLVRQATGGAQSLHWPPLTRALTRAWYLWPGSSRRSSRVTLVLVTSSVWRRRTQAAELIGDVFVQGGRGGGRGRGRGVNSRCRDRSSSRRGAGQPGVGARSSRKKAACSMPMEKARVSYLHRAVLRSLACCTSARILMAPGEYCADLLSFEPPRSWTEQQSGPQGRARGGSANHSPTQRRGIIPGDRQGGEPLGFILRTCIHIIQKSVNETRSRARAGEVREREHLCIY
ncbi:hypothetical protein EYF80_042966 [Liparis tanakae]|uniref:Uncharacterized protein n=1 Tax=Liparis tanakae TaxID=230148 RepID=A0A4Z2FZR5_9TELE|nr:hypothetical protein EYF80_042966 [Liparis tanakae]